MAWGRSNFDGRMRIWLLLIAVIVSFPALTDPSVLLGTITKVRDGDTIEVDKILIRLNGVSTPEMNEPLGPKSKAFMTDLVMGKRLRCELDGSKNTR
jgi:endonuclease YncB( thermonuclease family)